jgi:hypothetical protein
MHLAQGNTQTLKCTYSKRICIVTRVQRQIMITFPRYPFFVWSKIGSFGTSLPIGLPFMGYYIWKKDQPIGDWVFFFFLFLFSPPIVLFASQLKSWNVIKKEKKRKKKKESFSSSRLCGYSWILSLDFIVYF